MSTSSQHKQLVSLMIAMTCLAAILSMCVMPVTAQNAQAPPKQAPKKNAAAKQAPAKAPATAPANARAKAPPANYSVIALRWDVGSPEYKRIRPIKDRVIGGTIPFAANKAQFEQWYKDYFFRSFTQPDQLDKLPIKRQELLADLRRAGKTKPVHDSLLAMSVSYMTGFATSTRYNFHPAVRFNAMIILGQLNAREIGVTASERYPNPLPSALQTMLNAVSSQQTTDAVKVAAMIGLLRHAKLNWQRTAAQRIKPAERNAIVQQMLSELKQSEPPAGRSIAGHVWVQRRALEILAALGMIGQMDEVNTTIQAMLLDPNADLGLRCTAALALRSVNPAGQSQVDADAMSNGLASLAVATCENELSWIEHLKTAKRMKSLAANGMMGMAMGGGGEEMMGGDEPDMGAMMSGMMGGPGGGSSSMMGGMMGGSGSMIPGFETKEPEIDIARRRLITKLVCIQNGVVGVSAVASDADKPKLAEIGRYVNDLLQLVIVPDKKGDKDKNKDNKSVALNTIAQLEDIVKNSRRELAAIDGVVLAEAELEAEVETGPDVESAIPSAVPAAEAALSPTGS